MTGPNSLGFIGLGVMGSRMCANLVRRSQRPVTVFDPVPGALAQAVSVGAQAADSVGAVAADALAPLT